MLILNQDLNQSRFMSWVIVITSFCLLSGHSVNLLIDKELLKSQDQEGIFFFSLDYFFLYQEGSIHSYLFLFCSRRGIVHISINCFCSPLSKSIVAMYKVGNTMLHTHTHTCMHKLKSREKMVRLNYLSTYCVPDTMLNSFI